MAKGRFPQIEGGDVHIVVARGSQIYQLDSDTLRRASKFFEHVLTEDNAVCLSKRAVNSGITTRWHFELVERPVRGEHGSGKLHLMDIDADARVMHPNRRAPIDIENGMAPNPIFSHWHRVLGSIYNQPFEIEYSGLNNQPGNSIIGHDFVSVLEGVMGIVEVAEYLRCMSAVSRTLDVALVTHGQALWCSIANNPVVWSELGRRIQSWMIFKESVIHVVGQWNMLKPVQKKGLHASVYKLCARKHNELYDIKMKVDSIIYKYYPPQLSKNEDNGTKTIQRASYANDIFVWIALDIFRHWFGKAVISKNHRDAEDGGYWFYNCIGKNYDKYLTMDDLNLFHNRFPMSPKGKTVVRSFLQDIKIAVKPKCEQLLKNESSLDVDKFTVDWLTCIKLGKRDAPWLNNQGGHKGDEYTEAELGPVEVSGAGTRVHSNTGFYKDNGGGQGSARRSKKQTGPKWGAFEGQGQGEGQVQVQGRGRGRGRGGKISGSGRTVGGTGGYSSAMHGESGYDSQRKYVDLADEDEEDEEEEMEMDDEELDMFETMAGQDDEGEEDWDMN
ncbi:hypothetical protein K402DRAFT_432548 [Aulographum hederae CBS 113979]|uniref:BTB domain-containing protein n=1 Tax=Aulographum hederae CBS 113979 TaxID=1176131 RepID=A0A6G1GX84_9PEZI|nr:hypothetical protein K402DRAFT_432548 [Aulographum hederae CBS 113979]